MGRTWDITKATIKGTANDIGRATGDIAAHAIDRSDTPKTPVVDKDYATRTAAEHNDMPTVKSLAGVKKVPSYQTGTNYVPKTGPAILHKGEAVIPKEHNMGVIGDIKSAVDEFKSLGPSLAAKGSNISEYSDATSKTPAAKPAAKSAPAAKDSGKRFGDRPGEKRLDSEGNVMPKYHKGTSYVPKTGPAILQKGEAVIPKDKNVMDARTAMEGITGKKTAKPEKKIKEIRTHKTDDGKMIHTHIHHHPMHHPDETHVSNDMQEAQDHMAAQEPNMSAQPPEMPEAGGAPAGGAPMPGM